MQSLLSSKNAGELAYNVLVFLLYLFVVTFILKYLWNSTLVKYITVLRPIQGTGARSYVDVFLLAFAISIFKL
jgi:hypothetical protein